MNEDAQARLAAIVESSDDAIISKDLTGVITTWNTGAERVFGYMAEEAIGRHITMIIPVKRQDEEKHILSRIRRGDRVDHFETVRKRKDGRLIDISLTVSPIRAGNGTIIGASKVARDITDRKRIEQRLRRSLKEKELLLNEIHHRVKNNLQVISSLISLQSDGVRDAGMLAIFRESQNRIRTMALVHEKLYQSNNFSHVPFGEYLRDLVASLQKTYPLARNVAVAVEAEDTELGIDRAIPCGLMVNELVANSLEHAFPGGRTGRVVVSLRSLPGGCMRLAVTDNGVGLPGGLVIEEVESLGLRLIQALASQLQGHLTISRARGTRIAVTFKKDPASDRLEPEPARPLASAHG